MPPKLTPSCHCCFVPGWARGDVVTFWSWFTRVRELNKREGSDSFTLSSSLILKYLSGKNPGRRFVQGNLKFNILPAEVRTLFNVKVASCSLSHLHKTPEPWIIADCHIFFIVIHGCKQTICVTRRCVFIIRALIQLILFLISSSRKQDVFASRYKEQLGSLPSPCLLSCKSISSCLSYRSVLRICKIPWWPVPRLLRLRVLLLPSFSFIWKYLLIPY